MTTSYVSVTPDVTVSTAIEAVREYTENHHENVYNVYSLDGSERLTGFASLRDLLLAGPGQPLAEILRTNVLSVPPLADQEEVARKMAKYDLNVMPVIDEKGVILGVITIDDIIDVLAQEQTEDVQKLGGIEPLDVPYFRTSFLTFIKKRGVWLFILFFGEFFTQTALRHYDPVFDAIKGAAYYVPLLISAGGNSGSQSSTLIIRGMALGEIKMTDWYRILVRELAMGFVLGIGLAIVGFFRVLMYRDSHVEFALTGRDHARRDRDDGLHRRRDASDHPEACRARSGDELDALHRQPRRRPRNHHLRACCKDRDDGGPLRPRRPLRRLLLACVLVGACISCKRTKIPEATHVWLGPSGGCVQTKPNPTVGLIACWGPTRPYAMRTSIDVPSTLAVGPRESCAAERGGGVVLERRGARGSRGRRRGGRLRRCASMHP